MGHIADLIYTVVLNDCCIYELGLGVAPIKLKNYAM